MTFINHLIKLAKEAVESIVLYVPPNHVGSLVEHILSCDAAYRGQNRESVRQALLRGEVTMLDCRLKVFWPATIRPDEIATRPTEAFGLDGAIFVPQPYEAEDACRDGQIIGALGIDEDHDNSWRARKGDGEWRPMRCRAEARAFLVSETRT